MTAPDLSPIEAIVTIREVRNLKVRGKDRNVAVGDGYIVNTSRRKILFLISNQAKFCEDWGHFCSPDDLGEFIGAWLLKVEVTTTALDAARVEALDLEEGSDVNFVNLYTNRGVFQLCAHTSHQGAHGHYVWVCIDDMSYELTHPPKFQPDLLLVNTKFSFASSSS